MEVVAFVWLPSRSLNLVQPHPPRSTVPWSRFSKYGRHAPESSARPGCAGQSEAAGKVLVCGADRCHRRSTLLLCSARYPPGARTVRGPWELPALWLGLELARPAVHHRFRILRSGVGANIPRLRLHTTVSAGVGSHGTPPNARLSGHNTLVQVTHATACVSAYFTEEVELAQTFVMLHTQDLQRAQMGAPCLAAGSFDPDDHRQDSYSAWQACHWQQAPLLGPCLDWHCGAGTSSLSGTSTGGVDMCVCCTAAVAAIEGKVWYTAAMTACCDQSLRASTYMQFASKHL